MRFRGLDLNLLVLFEALMRTRSVSRTAVEMNVSQPAISSALKRLRQYFGDDILTLRNKRMFPTAYAESLLPRVRTCLQEIEGLITTSTQFDPASSQRTFRVCSSDYMATAILAPLALRLAIEAPDVRLELLLSDDDSIAQLDLGAIDLLITPEGYMERTLPAKHLLDERSVVVGWNKNPIFASPLDETAFLGARHVQTAIGYHRDLAFGDRELAMMGKHRVVEIVASSFTIMPFLLIDTMRLGIMHERLAKVMARLHPLSIAEIPFPFPVMREMMQFHPARGEDPGLLWLMDCLIAQASIGNPC